MKSINRMFLFVIMLGLLGSVSAYALDEAAAPKPGMDPAMMEKMKALHKQAIEREK